MKIGKIEVSSCTINIVSLASYASSHTYLYFIFLESVTIKILKAVLYFEDNCEYKKLM